MKRCKLFRSRTNEDGDVLATVRRIPVDQIGFDPEMPQTDVGQERIASLAGSIRKYGIVEPLLLRDADNDEEEKVLCSVKDRCEVSLISDHAYGAPGSKPLYYIVSGSCRFRAALLLGLETVPCLMTDLGRESAAELVCVLEKDGGSENWTKIAEYAALLMRKYGWTSEKAAELFDMAELTGSVMNAYHDAPEEEKMLVRDANFTVKQYAALNSVRSPKARRLLFRAAAEKRLSERQTSELVRKYQLHRTFGGGQTLPSSRIRLFINTIERSAALLRENGIPTEVEKEENEGRTDFLISVLH